LLEVTSEKSIASRACWKSFKKDKSVASRAYWKFLQKEKSIASRLCWKLLEKVPTASPVFSLLAFITYPYLKSTSTTLTTQKSVHLQRVMKVLKNTEFIVGFYQPDTF
jgi:hypothetical protein